MAEYIEREAAKLRIFEYGVRHRNNSSISSACENLERQMNSIPAADVRPVVRGKWIDRDDDYYGWNMWACSACGDEFVLTEGTPDMNDYHFCPNCGADMRETNDEEA